ENAKDAETGYRSGEQARKGIKVKARLVTKKGRVNMKVENLSSFDDFLKEDGLYEQTKAVAIKRVIAYQIEEEMRAQNITQTELAQRMNTSRAVVSRLLNPKNASLTLSTLSAAVSALGKKLDVSII
uniref:XRE family transcriptional regulator n=1 Tax=uncultured Campylobacter sp. TaxID=218934 RepID=UPI00260C4A34